MLKDIFTKLEHVANAKGRNDKIALIAIYLNDHNFKEVVIRALSSDTVYHVSSKSLPAYSGPKPSGKNIFNILDILNSQEGASKADKLALSIAASTNPETYEVVKRIVNKDLKCGIDVKSINKALPDTIYYTPYCRCSGDDESVENKFWAKPGKKYGQLKEDGMFFNYVFHAGHRNLEFITRNGKLIRQLERLESRLYKVTKEFPNMVRMGEMVILHDGKVLNRQTGNGILNKLIHGTAPQHEADKVAIRLWDSVPYADFWEYECPLDYEERLYNTREFVEKVNDVSIADVVYTEELPDKAAADDFYIRMRAAGEEGSVLKLGTAKWKDHTSPDQIKKKNVSTCALVATGWKLGSEDSKYKDVMGAVFFESRCGELKVTVNGKSDEMRGWNWDDEIGTIWTIAFERISYSKSRKAAEASLYLPRIVEKRFDRSYADTLEEIIAREQKKKD